MVETKKFGDYFKGEKSHESHVTEHLHLGYDKDVSVLMMSYLSPPELINTCQFNKLLLQSLSMDMVIKSVLFSGKNGMKSMKALYPLKKK